MATERGLRTLCANTPPRPKPRGRGKVTNKTKEHDDDEPVSSNVIDKENVAPVARKAPQTDANQTTPAVQLSAEQAGHFEKLRIKALDILPKLAAKVGTACARIAVCGVVDSFEFVQDVSQRTQAALTRIEGSKCVSARNERA